MCSAVLERCAKPCTLWAHRAQHSICTHGQTRGGGFQQFVGSCLWVLLGLAPSALRPPGPPTLWLLCTFSLLGCGATQACRPRCTPLLPASPRCGRVQRGPSERVSLWEQRSAIFTHEERAHFLFPAAVPCVKQLPSSCIWIATSFAPSWCNVWHLGALLSGGEGWGGGKH